MNLTMKRSDVMRLWNGLHSVGELRGVQFAHAISKTQRYLKDEIAAIEDSLKPSSALKAYNKLRLELCNKHAAHDEDGKPKTRIDPTSGQNTFVMENQDAFDKELEELQAKHPEAIEEKEEQKKAYAELMKEEIEIQVHWVARADVPANITVDQMTNIFDLVVEDPE